MTSAKTDKEQPASDRRVLQTAIRLGLLALLILWCFQIVRPFVSTIVWGVIIAIAVQTPYRKLRDWLGGRPRLAASLLVFIALLVLIVPTIVLGASLVETATELSDDLSLQEIKVPPPPESIAQLPLIGERLHALWTRASVNLESVLAQFMPQLKEIGLWLVSTMGHLGFGILMFIISIIIAGALLPNGERAAGMVREVATIIAGSRGPKLAELAGSSIQNVTRGVLGVAAIQSILMGVGMLAVDVPAAGLWTLLILILAVMQLPSMLVIIPVILYVFSTSSTAVAVLFAIWGVLVGASDNVLKPMLMGRGSEVPMLVLFLGSLGGFMLEGFIGLFVGAVVLSLGYTIFMAWIEEAETEDEATAPTQMQ